MPEVSTLGSAVPGTVVSSGALITPGGDVGPTGPQGPAGSGTGDMLKSVYDTNANSVVDTCDSLAWSKVTGVPAAFTPLAHATTHLDNGTDAIPVATTTRTGLAPARSGTATTFLNGTGAYTTPTGVVPSAHASTHALGGSDQTSPDWTQIVNKPTSMTPSAHASTHVTGGSDVIALATSSARGLLTQVSGLTTDYVTGNNTCADLASAVTPTITAVRLRSFNALAYGNATFEVDQRNAGGLVTNPSNGIFACDRWIIARAASTMALNTQRTTVAGGISVPGTNFKISSCSLTVTVTTAQASLAAGDSYQIIQRVEGCTLRELIGDVHSVSILAQSSIANLAFGLAINDGSSRSLTKLCTLGTANTWQLLTFPNLPVFSAGGAWSLLPGNQGYQFIITLACGTTFMSPANDVWQTGNYVGAVGQQNFAATNGATFQLAFIQHEPGAVASLPMDLSYDSNLTSCERYFTKSYQLTDKPGTVTNVGFTTMFAQANQSPLCHIPFKRTMAKVPTITGYSNTSGASGNVRDNTAAADKAISFASGIGDGGFSGFSVTTPNAAIWNPSFHYSADSGW